MGAVVCLREVHKTYALGKAEVCAVREVSLEVAAGEFLAIAGSSGSGKTTLLNLIGCVDRPSAGEVIVAGKNTTRLSERELTALRLFSIGFVFQSFNLISVLTAFQNVELPLLLQGVKSARERRARVYEMLAAVGLDGYGRHRPNELSGGERQRVAVARALVGRPALVLADEPTANLDSATGAGVITLMREQNRRDGTTFIFATHDPAVIAEASSVVRLADGRIAGRA